MQTLQTLVALDRGHVSMMLIVSTSRVCEYSFIGFRWLISVKMTNFTSMMVPQFMMVGGMMTILGGLSSLKDPKIASVAAKQFFDAIDRVSSIDPTNLSGNQLLNGKRCLEPQHAQNMCA